MRELSRALYALGSLTAAVLAALALLRAPWVPFPGAMLPMTLGELAALWLAASALPMALAVRLVRRHGGLRLRRPALLWLPVLPCALCALYISAVLVIALAKSVLHTALP